MHYKLLSNGKIFIQKIFLRSIPVIVHPMLYIDLRQIDNPVYLYYLRWKKGTFQQWFNQEMSFSRNFKDLRNFIYNFEKTPTNFNTFHRTLINIMN
jgi:hypothetical protein